MPGNIQAPDVISICFSYSELQALELKFTMALYTLPPMRQRKAGVFNGQLARELVKLSAVGLEIAISDQTYGRFREIRAWIRCNLLPPTFETGEQ